MTAAQLGLFAEAEARQQKARGQEVIDGEWCPPADLAAFLAAFPGRPVHFLGAGRGYLASVAHLLDGRQISHDTCRIRAWVGRTNGRAGGRRPLTAAQDAARASGLEGRAMKRCALTTVLEQLG